MPPSGVHRNLTAILVTGVGGYSRLMGGDPEGIVEKLKRPVSTNPCALRPRAASRPRR